MKHFYFRYIFFIKKNVIFNKYIDVKMNYAFIILSQIDLIINIIMIHFLFNEKKKL